MVHNAPKSTGKAKNTSNRRQRIGKGKAGGKNWLKNGNPPGDPQNAPRCGRKLVPASPARPPVWLTEDAACTEALAPGRGPRKDWQTRGVLAGNMGAILPLKSKIGDVLKDG